MSIAIGTRLGPYEVVAAIGAGGMGEVYRARDTKLNRDVAIKVLPDLFANDPERLARFQREAQVLASLNHPHIAHIYGLEESPSTGSGQAAVRALVMELVEGEDLAQRIARGPIPLEDALPIARQIAEALEAAHEQGSIHRDLKPANIKVRADGTVKVLDFGLAKLAQASDSGLRASGNLTHSPTITSPAVMTGAGMILGTAAYMAPEQARGKAVDKRADIWAFGCVLYEMLTGTQAFETGETVSDAVAAILKNDPDWKALPGDTPAYIRTLVRRCLQKDPQKRLPHIGIARIDIEEAPAVGSTPGTPDTVSSLRQRLPWILAASAAVIALGLAVPAVQHLRETPAVSRVTRTEIVTPPTVDSLSFAVSPDGQWLAFSAVSEGETHLWLRSLTTGDMRPITGTERARFPFWSPDSRVIGFFSDNRLYRVGLDDSAPQMLASAPLAQGGTWSQQGVIVFASLGRPLMQVRDTGGAVSAIPGVAPLHAGHFAPSFLPDGRHFLYYIRGNPSIRGIYVGGLDAQTATKRLFDADFAVYDTSGQLLFVRDGTLLAQRFDSGRFEARGDAHPIATGMLSAFAYQSVSISAEGTLVFRTGVAATDDAVFGRTGAGHFERFNRVGNSVPVPGLGVAGSPALSPDGRRIAFQLLQAGNIDVWSLDLARGIASRVTVDPSDDVMAVWSPDGTRLVFSSNRRGVHDLFQKSVAGAGDETVVLATPQPKFATDWSPDGRFVLFVSYDSSTGVDLWAVAPDGAQQPIEVVRTEFDEQDGQFSPDGKWIAYQSNETGRPEIWVQSFPGGDSKTRISPNGGAQVRWRADNRELFYVALDQRMMAVPIHVDSDRHLFQPGTPVPLFQLNQGSPVQERQQYVVTRDGREFVAATGIGATRSLLSLVMNWREMAAQ